MHKYTGQYFGEVLQAGSWCHMCIGQDLADNLH